MGDEGRGVAVLGRNFDLLVDHDDSSRSITMASLACNTIARKPQHDKASRLSCGPRDLNPVAWIAIVAKVVTKVPAQPEFLP
jgi:hypothetical protein